MAELASADVEHRRQMSWRDIQRPESVRQAAREFDALGREAFLQRYGFGRAYNFFLELDGRLYDSKAILGVAHKYEFDEPLSANEFSGGDNTVRQKLEALGFGVRVLSERVTKEYWWRGQPAEKYWIEIRHVEEELGLLLRCPFLDESGHSNPWYDLIDDLIPGQVIYHWNANQGRFVGVSLVAQERLIDQQTGERIVALTDFTPLRVLVDLEKIRGLSPLLTTGREELGSEYPGSVLYLPFQFRADGLRLMSNYFTKLPVRFQEILFGPGGLAEDDLPPPDPENGADAQAPPAGVRAHYLDPFREKADSEYLVNIQGGLRRRGRRHETLVNRFAVWLQERGFQVGRNAAIDIGLESPNVIIEAKAVSSWARAIREAVGQLYEYRHFQVVPPDSKLVFLSNLEPPLEWIEYLEEDRGIGVAWPEDGGFILSPIALRALGLD